MIKMKRALLFLILGITIQSHANSEAELDKEIETIGNDIKSLELICDKRKVIRSFISLLEDIENSKELMQLTKENERDASIVSKNFHEFKESHETLLQLKWLGGILLFVGAICLFIFKPKLF